MHALTHIGTAIVTWVFWKIRISNDTVLVGCYGNTELPIMTVASNRLHRINAISLKLVRVSLNVLIVEYDVAIPSNRYNLPAFEGDFTLLASGNTEHCL